MALPIPGEKKRVHTEYPSKFQVERLKYLFRSYNYNGICECLFTTPDCVGFSSISSPCAVPHVHVYMRVCSLCTCVYTCLPPAAVLYVSLANRMAANGSRACPVVFPLIRHLPLGNMSALTCGKPTRGGRGGCFPQSWLYVAFFDMPHGVFWAIRAPGTNALIRRRAQNRFANET